MAAKVTKLVVVGIPDLIAPLKQGGFKLLTESTDIEDVWQAVRSLTEDDNIAVSVILKATSDTRTKDWAELMVRQKRRVVVVQPAEDNEMPWTESDNAFRIVVESGNSNNVTLNDVTHLLGAPKRPGGDYLLSFAPKDENNDSFDGGFDFEETTAHWEATPIPPVAASPWEQTPQPVEAQQPSWTQQSTPAPVEPQQPAWEQTPAPVEAQQPAWTTPAPATVEPQQPAWTTPAPVEPQQPAWTTPAPVEVQQPAWTTPATVEPRQVESAWGEDIHEPRHFSPKKRMPGEKCPVIVSWAGKGGTGKSGGAIALAAEYVARRPDHKVVLVDMNRGQGDIRQYLRLSKDQTLLTIYDAVMRDSPKSAIMSPARVTAARSPKLPPVKFGVVLSPRPEQADPSVVTAQFYRAVIEAARESYDMVIVDTQIMESFDTSGLIDGVAIPLVQSHRGYAAGVSDVSMPGVDNTSFAMSKFGVDSSKMMFYLNKHVEESALDIDHLKSTLYEKAEVVGVVPQDSAVVVLVEGGGTPNEFGPMGKVARAILYRVTGDPAFDIRDEPTPKKGLFSFLKKRG